MDTDKKQKIIDDLALALIYLTGWEEKGITGEPYTRAWKGYDFGALDRLKEQGLIDFTRTAKSLNLTEEGKERAAEVVQELIR
jgi:hypothetical protein